MRMKKVMYLVLSLVMALSIVVPVSANEVEDLPVDAVCCDEDHGDFTDTDDLLVIPASASEITNLTADAVCCDEVPEDYADTDELVQTLSSCPAGVYHGQYVYTITVSVTGDPENIYCSYHKGYFVGYKSYYYGITKCHPCDGIISSWYMYTYNSLSCGCSFIN